MRNRARVVPGVLLIMLAFVIAGMTVAGCGKQKAAESEKQASANEERQTAPDAEAPPPGSTEEEKATDAGNQPPSDAGTLPPAGEEKPATQPPAGAEQQPPEAGEVPPGGEQQAPGETQTPPESGEQTTGGTPPPAETPGESAPPAAGSFKYVGVAACAICHKGAAKGSIYEVWLASSHAKAFENLGPENQKNEVCLACHTTGFGKPLAANVTPGKMVNVQCEACHGPGSEYKALAVMKSRPDALEKGLILPTKQVCLGCHGGRFPEGHPTVAFNYESALLRIEHHSKPTETAK